MPDFSMSNLAVAFSITLAAGLFTVLGGGLVMFSKTPNPRVLSFGLAFAGGAMVYVSLTEIFSKSSEAFAEIYDKDHAFAAATMAFLAGMGGIALIDRLVPNPHETLDAQGPIVSRKQTPPYRASRHDGGVCDYGAQFPRRLGDVFCHLGKSGGRDAFGLGDCHP